MNPSIVRTVGPIHGLALLMQLGTGYGKHRHLDDCGEYTRRRHNHPFGLDLPAPQVCLDPEAHFVGARATNISVDVFLANVRFWANYSDGSRVEKLRVITAPFRQGNVGQHHVFFEMWVGNLAIISGETTDFSGAGNEAREQLEDLFALLSNVYGVEITRVDLREEISIPDLYA